MRVSSSFLTVIQ